MIYQPMSPELTRIVHERQLVEAARRREERLLTRSLPARPGPRQLLGAALVRAGRAIASEPVAPAPDVIPRPRPVTQCP